MSELDSATGGSVIRSLLRRELGTHDKTVFKIVGLVHRQLIKGRSKSNAGPLVPVSVNGRRRRAPSPDIVSFAIPRPRAKSIELSTSTTSRYHIIPDKPKKLISIFKQSGQAQPGAPHTVLDTSSVPTTVAVIGDHFFVRKSRDDEPSYCFSMTSLSSRDGLPHKYAIPSKKEWKDSELFYPATDNPDPVIYRQKFGQALFILSKDCVYLTIYDVNTGRKLDRLYLDPKIKFTSMALCWEDYSRFVVQSKKTSLPPILIVDFILLEYPPLKVAVRCQITKKAFPKATKADVAGCFIYVVYPNCIEICDLISVLNPEFEHNMRQESSVQALGSESPVKITHYVDAKLPVLHTVNTFQFHLEITALGSLPHFISKNKDGTLMVYNFEERQVGNSDLLDLNLRSDTDKSLSSLRFHPDESPRLIFCGENQLRVLRITISELSDGRPGDSYLETEFDFTQAQAQARQATAAAAQGQPQEGESTVPTGRRSGRNVNRKVSYSDDSEVGVKWAYHAPVDVFAIMEMSKDSLKFYLYDNQNWSSIAVIEPTDFWRAPMEGGEFTVPITTFDFEDSHLMVQIHKTGQNISKVYLVGLLSEAVSDKAFDRRTSLKRKSN